MALFTDTVTVYNRISDTEWRRTIVEGVQWTDKIEKKNTDGVLTVVQYVSVTFPEGTYENLEINASDAIILGEITDEVGENRGERIGDLLKKYPDSGTVRSVKNNSRRTYLKNVKVVLE